MSEQHHSLGSEMSFYNLRERLNMESLTNEQVDKIVLDLQRVIEKKELRSQLETKLIASLERLMRSEIRNIFVSEATKLRQRGVTEDDLFSEAVILLLKSYPKWISQNVRTKEGNVPAHFSTFFFSKFKLFLLDSVKFKKAFKERSVLDAPTGVDDGGAKLRRVDLKADPKAEEFVDGGRLDEQVRKELVEEKVVEMINSPNPMTMVCLALHYGFPSLVLENIDLLIERCVDLKEQTTNQTEKDRLNERVEILQKIKTGDLVLPEEKMFDSKIGRLFNFSKTRSQQYVKSGQDYLKEALKAA